MPTVARSSCRGEFKKCSWRRPCRIELSRYAAANLRRRRLGESRRGPGFILAHPDTVRARRCVHSDERLRNLVATASTLRADLRRDISPALQLTNRGQGRRLARCRTRLVWVVTQRKTVRSIVRRHSQMLSVSGSADGRTSFPASACRVADRRLSASCFVVFALLAARAARLVAFRLRRPRRSSSSIQSSSSSSSRRRRRRLRLLRRRPSSIRGFLGGGSLARYRTALVVGLRRGRRRQRRSSSDSTGRGGSSRILLRAASAVTVGRPAPPGRRASQSSTLISTSRACEPL